MKLRIGKPLWLATKGAPLHVYRLSRTVTCDVAIIGAGITGALVAHQLLKAGLKVVMIDKRRVGLGSTAASTGLLMVQPDSSIADLTRLHDRRTARRVYQLGQKAIRDLGVLARQLKLDCGWKAKRTLYLASNHRGATLLKSEAKRARQIGYRVKHLSPERLQQQYALPFEGALLSAGSAQVHAFDLTRGVLRHIERNPDFSLYQNTRVTSLEENAESIRLSTHTGGEVYARHVIVAAGYESRRFVRSKLVRLRSTYVIASKPFPAARLYSLRCLMWETARPYFYLRTTADHRIVFGGADEPFVTDSGRMRKLKRKTRELEQAFAAMFPQLAFEADYAWSGVFAETSDGLPCIGPKKPGSRVFYALGYGGNGITFGQIAAGILRDACLGKKNPDARLFAFRRLSKGRR
jgi:glycine/D-amino acid oxidase-like deaminating enzyme